MDMTTLQYCLARPAIVVSASKPHLPESSGHRVVSASLQADARLKFSCTRVVRSHDGGRRRSSQLCLAAAEPLPESLPEGSSGLAEEESSKSVWKNWRANAAELRAKLSKWGLPAVLAYGLFDGITYTTFFVLAFLSYEKTTGQNPAANLKALLGVVVLMWGGNNVTRPFRVAGAAALAPFIDKGLKKIQSVLRLPNQAFAFMICVATFASACLSVVGILILSRLRR